MRPYIKCPDCNGTGSSVPDCSVCHGYLSMPWRAFMRHGYRKADLIICGSDDFADCPRCDADHCALCHGDGQVHPAEADQQRERVLIFGLTNELVPIIRQGGIRGAHHRLDRDPLLSREAAHQLRHEGKLHWFRSVFGDDIMLTPAGEEAARVAKVRHALRLSAMAN